MATRKVYQVTQTSPLTFIDNAGRVVNGFLVWVNLLEWNEAFSIQVKTLDPKEVDAKVKALINQRKGVDSLGDE